MKNYIPIDRSGELKLIIEENFQAGEFILIDKVGKELMGYENGIVFREFPFLKKMSIKTDTIIPNGIFYSHLDDFVDQDIANRTKNPFTLSEIEQQKESFLKKADGRIIIYAHSIIADNPIVVTEETIKRNDGKLIRKIPFNCSVLNLKCRTFPQLLKENFSVNLARK